MEGTQTINSPRRHGGLWMVILVIIVAFLAWAWFTDRLPMTKSSSTSGYQAVFLDNNQVYFGKLSNMNRNFTTLTEIFYLQISQPLQPSEPASNVNLIKLGAELHGPSDEMKINREHILFVENLKEDSQVSQAIKRYKEEQAKQAETPAATD
ncbi:MAG: hypothetical protein AAB455_01765 [Patescibacteria group bacterium]